MLGISPTSCLILKSPAESQCLWSYNVNFKHHNSQAMIFQALLVNFGFKKQTSFSSGHFCAFPVVFSNIQNNNNNNLQYRAILSCCQCFCRGVGGLNYSCHFPNTVPLGNN